ncbi:MAG: leucine-rich repeat domain-containing protein, partial [Fibrobacter sp.]|nr:leucine-rich repeat domain-containing protein [Fibrobacter sp.]
MENSKKLLKIAAFAAVSTTILLIGIACNSRTSSNLSDNTTPAIIPADTIYRLDDGVWDRARIETVIASIPDNGTVTFTGNLSEEILQNIRYCMIKRTKKIVLDLGSCTGSVDFPDSAFLGCSSLREITIPSNVGYIGNSVFLGCSGLENVTIYAGVEKIGNLAFSGCSGLKNVTIYTGVKIIGDLAFSGCSSLTNVIIPPGVTEIGNNAFRDCR